MDSRDIHAVQGGKGLVNVPASAVKAPAAGLNAAATGAAVGAIAGLTKGPIGSQVSAMQAQQKSGGSGGGGGGGGGGTATGAAASAAPAGTSDYAARLAQLQTAAGTPYTSPVDGALAGQMQSLYNQISGNAPTASAPTAFEASPYLASLQQAYNDMQGKTFSIPGFGFSYKDFDYNLNSDMLYQNYRDQYMQNGRQAMMDTLGQASALTGGYGSSYASTAGNQAYQQWLTQLNDKIPELYDRAYQHYSDDRNLAFQTAVQAWQAAAQNAQLQASQYNADRQYAWNALNQQYQNEYNLWRDTTADQQKYDQLSYDRWNSDRTFAYNAWQDAEDRATQADNTAYTRWLNDRNFTYDMLSDERSYASKLANTMLSRGYMPSADTLRAAGISAEDAARFVPTGGGYTGGGGTQTTQTAAGALDLSGALNTKQPAAAAQPATPDNAALLQLMEQYYRNPYQQMTESLYRGATR